jgi:putative ABC transport system ATP-binding protein
MDMLTEIAKAGTTVVMVTHSHAHAAYAERTLNLLDGQVVAATQMAA